MSAGVLAPRLQANTHDRPDTDSSAAALHHTLGAAATQAAAGVHSHGAGGFAFMFGTGVDGSATLDGAVTPAWAGRAGSVYTLNRDANPLNLTINAGVTLKTNGFRLYVAGTLTNRGSITQSGADGGVISFGNGAAVNATRTLAGAGGGNGATGSAGGNGTGAGSYGPGPINGGPGGNGGGAPTNTGGNGATLSPYTGGSVNAGPNTSLLTLLTGIMVGSTSVAVQGGGGGGGGAAIGSGSGSGGGGAGAGGVILIGCAVLDNAGGIIRAAGGNGGPGQLNGATTAAGGGGGGGGGAVLVTYGHLIALGTIDAPGGNGGAHAGAAGVDGSPGSAGTVITARLGDYS